MWTKTVCGGKKNGPNFRAVDLGYMFGNQLYRLNLRPASKLNINGLSVRTDLGWLPWK